MLKVWCWDGVGRRSNSFVVAKQVDFYYSSKSRAERREITYFTSNKADECADTFQDADVGKREENAV